MIACKIFEEVMKQSYGCSHNSFWKAVGHKKQALTASLADFKISSCVHHVLRLKTFTNTAILYVIKVIRTFSIL